MPNMHSTTNFTKEKVAALYLQLAKSAFSSALRKFMEGRTLSLEQKAIAAAVIDKAKTTPEFFTRSFFIYLSNGAIDEKNPLKLSEIQQQLFLELGIRLLEFGMVEKIVLSQPKEMFCLGLNQAIPAFSSITKKEDVYVFHTVTGEVVTRKRRENCITDDIYLLHEDRNPYNTNNDHPDQKHAPYVAYDLGGIPEEKWVAQFRNAYALIKEKVPSIYDEIYLFLDAIGPHGYAPSKQMSSSYSRSPGILYLSFTDEDLTQAEAIVHETHHTIYNIIEWKTSLHSNNSELKYYSAYRPDARHIRGCFLGLHAFVAVQNFYASLCKSSTDEKMQKQFLSLYLKNRIVIGVLEKYAEFTESGKLLFDDVCMNFHKDDMLHEHMRKSHSPVYTHTESEVLQHLEEAKRTNAVLLH